MNTYGYNRRIFLKCLIVKMHQFYQFKRNSLDYVFVDGPKFIKEVDKQSKSIPRR